MILLRPEAVDAFVKADGSTSTGALRAAIDAVRQARSVHVTTGRGDTILLRKLTCSLTAAKALRHRAWELGRELRKLKSDDGDEGARILFNAAQMIARALVLRGGGQSFCIRPL